MSNDDLWRSWWNNHCAVLFIVLTKIYNCHRGHAVKAYHAGSQDVRYDIWWSIVQIRWICVHFSKNVKWAHSNQQDVVGLHRLDAGRLLLLSEEFRTNWHSNRLRDNQFRTVMGIKYLRDSPFRTVMRITYFALCVVCLLNSLWIVRLSHWVYPKQRWKDFWLSG